MSTARNVVGVIPCLISGWWFGTFVFPYIGNNNPNWLIFFGGVETTNQLSSLMMKENNVKPLLLEFPITYLAMGCSIVGISQDESNDRWSHWNLWRPKTHQSWLMFGNPPHYGTRTCLICELHKLSKYMGIHSIFKFMLEDLRFWELVAGCFLRIEYRVSARAIGPAQPLSWFVWNLHGIRSSHAISRQS